MTILSRAEIATDVISTVRRAIPRTGIPPDARNRYRIRSPLPRLYQRSHCQRYAKAPLQYFPDHVRSRLCIVFADTVKLALQSRYVREIELDRGHRLFEWMFQTNGNMLPGKCAHFEHCCVLELLTSHRSNATTQQRIEQGLLTKINENLRHVSRMSEWYAAHQNSLHSFVFRHEVTMLLIRQGLKDRIYAREFIVGQKKYSEYEDTESNFVPRKDHDYCGSPIVHCSRVELSN